MSFPLCRIKNPTILSYEGGGEQLKRQATCKTRVSVGIVALAIIFGAGAITAHYFVGNPYLTGSLGALGGVALLASIKLIVEAQLYSKNAKNWHPTPPHIIGGKFQNGIESHPHQE